MHRLGNMPIRGDGNTMGNTKNKLKLQKNTEVNFTKLCTIFIEIEIENKSQYKPVIGLEIHAQISSKSKLFSGAGTSFAAPVNNNVSLFDAAIPGTLPVLNRFCVEAAVKTALALNCEINPVSTFERKHYFYADLPAGYQITQQQNPIASKGFIEFPVYSSLKQSKLYYKKSILKQVQIEQDSGKSLHDEINKRSLIDLNRAGVPLLELVFEADLSDGEEAAALVKELSLILLSLKTCSCKMEEGALRVDANVSIHRENEPLGPRTEIKNIGSVRGVAAAISYEIKRQTEIVKKKGNVVSETRAWNAEKKITVPMREKEERQDYRFFHEINLPPLHLKMPNLYDIFGDELVDVENIMYNLPELPANKRLYLIEHYKLSPISAIILVNEQKLYDYFYNIMNNTSRNPQTVANLLMMEFLGTIHKTNLSLHECEIPSEYLGELVDMLEEESINLLTVRRVLKEIIGGNKLTPKDLVKQNNWFQIINDTEVDQICKQILEENPDLVKQYKSGKQKVFKALLGKVANSTENKINMLKVTNKLKELLK